VSLVVGAAIVRHGTVLAARRTTPAAVAGRWELPGGKVEAGESPEGALVREIREELGCLVEVRGWLDGEQPIGTEHVLRAALCRVAHGEPSVGADHDRLRRLGPEQLDDVDWLAPDRPFLAELRATLLDGEALPGGNVGGAVRIGDTVRRPTGPWTPAVHALLDHLHAASLRAVPRVHGLDARGREILDYLPGEVVDVDSELLSEARLEDLGRWTRELHDALRDFRHPGPWRFFDVPEAELVCHNDVAPYNVCFQGDLVTGVFDWDLAGPSTRLLELAQLAWTAVPLYRSIPTDVAARRLRMIARAYAGRAPGEILRAVAPLKRLGIAGIEGWIRVGDPAGVAQAAIGEPGRTERALADLERRLPALERAVGDTS
jgi:8-oxo-dGTP pyrophosphatase MutT (NUDIX family)/aminoglycoside phosphotransferase